MSTKAETWYIVSAFNLLQDGEYSLTQSSFWTERIDNDFAKV